MEERLEISTVYRE